MEAPSFIQRLREILPVETQTWVINALRQDQTVWQSLQNTSLTGKALATCSNQPMTWTPGLLSLLALDVNVSQELFNATPLNPLETVLCQKASQAYENFLKGKQFSEHLEEIKITSLEPGSSDDQSISSLSPVDTLAEAGLVALALRERLHGTGSWNSFALEIWNQPEVPLKHWYTPLACLLGLIPDPVEFMSAFIHPGASIGAISLALHAFLCNPLPIANRLIILQNIFTDGQYSQTSELSEKTAVLRLLSLQQEELAKSLAEWILEQGNLPALVNADFPESLSLERMKEIVNLTEILQIAGRTDKSLEILSKAQQSARWLQAELAAYWATTAESGSLANVDETNQRAILKAWEEAVEWTPASYVKDGNSPFQSHLSLARLKEGENLTGEAYLPEIEEEESVSDSTKDAETLLAMAQVALQLGDLSRAKQYASEALVAAREPTSQIDENIFEPLQNNLLRNRQENYRALARLFYELGLYEKCVEILDISLSTNPNDPELLFQLGKALQASYKQTDANQTFQLALMLSPTRLDIHQSLADGLESIGAWNYALPERQSILSKTNPEDPQALSEAYHALAQCALQVGKLDLMVDASEKAISINPEDGLAYFFLGEAALEQSNLKASLDHFNQAVQFSPHLPEPWLGLSKTYHAMGEENKVIDTLKEAVQAAPLSYEIHFSLGEEYLAQDAHTQARMSFQRAYELANAAQNQAGEFHWKIALQLGKVLHQLGHLHEADEVLEKAYQRDYFGGHPRSELAYAYSKTLLALGKTNQVVPVLREALKEKPQDTTPYLDYAKSLLETGVDPKEAVHVLQLAIEKDPSLLEARALLAEALSASGDDLSAMKAYQASLETELSKDRKWVARLSYGMGSSSLALGYIDTAIAALQEAIHADPTPIEYHQKLCEAYWAANLYNNAIQAGRSALNLETDNPNILLWFAEQAARFYKLSNPKIQTSGQEPNCDDPQPDRLYGIKPKQVLSEAMNALSQAAQIAPQRADICLKLGELQILAGERKSASESFRQVISKEIVTLEDLLTTAEWLTNLGENNATVACLERAISVLKAKQGGIPCELMENLAQAYLQTGNTEYALETLRQAIGVYPQQAELHLKLAQIFIKSGREEDALTSLRDSLSILEDNKDLSNIYYHLAQIQRGLGELPDALSNAEQALLLSETEEVHEKFDWLHLAKHYLAAELARALLRTKDARSYLEGKFHALLTAEQLETMDPEILNTLLGYYCMKSELALEGGEEIEAANALTPAVQAAPTHPRSLALQSRFQHRRGDDELALRTLHEALLQLPIPQELGGNGSQKENYLPNNRYPNPHTPESKGGFAAVDYISLSETAIELKLWDLALYLIEQALQANPQEHYLKLCLASLIIRKAEQQYLCQNLEILTHAPGEDALSSEQAELSLKLITAVKQSLPSVEGEPQLSILAIWESRGRAVFEYKVQGALTEGIDWSVLPKNEETAAAQLAHWMRKGALAQEDVLTNAPLAPNNVTNPLDPDQEYLEAASRISQAYPQSVLVQLLTGLIFEPHQPTQALYFVQHAATLQNTTLTSLAAMSHALLARLAFQTSNYELANQAIDTALNIWSNEPRWHALAAAISIQKAGANQDAITHLETAVQLEPQNYSHLIKLGLAYYQMAKHDPSFIQTALKAFEKASHLEPNRPDAWIYMAETILLESDSSALTKAATLVDRAISLASSGQKKEPPLHFYLLRAEIAFRMEDPDSAIQFAQKVLFHEPQNTKAAWLKAQSLERLNRPAEALTVLEKVIHTGDEPLFFQLKKVALLRQTQSPEVPLKQIRELAEKNPDQPEVLSLLAQILLDSGLNESAIQAAQMALKSSPNQADLNAQEKAQLHYMIGMQAVENGQLDNAIHHLNETIQLRPSFVEPYLELGFAYSKSRQYLKAQNIFQQATVIAPDDPRPFLHTGLALKEGKDYQSAETMLRRAAQLAPSDIQIRKHLAAVAALNLVHNPHNINIAAGR